MEFITIEDETGVLETVLFPAACESHARTITTAGPYVFEGEMLRERRSAHLDVRRVAAVLLGFAKRSAVTICSAKRSAVPGTARAVPGRAGAGERAAAVMAPAGGPHG